MGLRETTAGAGVLDLALKRPADADDGITRGRSWVLRQPDCCASAGGNSFVSHCCQPYLSAAAV
jgi:hypothetical protein